MKTLASIVTTLCVAASTVSAFATEPTVEAQFRLDYEMIVRREWRVKPPDRADDVSREVDHFVEGLRSHRPSFLQAEERVPADAEIQSRWEKLVAIEGGSLERRSPLWQYYVPLWKERKMNRAQKVIFSRMIASIAEEHEERNKKRERKNG